MQQQASSSSSQRVPAVLQESYHAGALRRPDSPGVCDTWEACDRRPGKVPGRRVLCAPRGARGRAAQKRGHRLVEKHWDRFFSTNLTSVSQQLTIQ